MWKNINFNIQNIEHETGKATLIKMPNNSEYKGYSFWHPSKLIRNGKHSYSASLGYTDTFEFKLVKYGKGKHNSSEILEEIKIDVATFEEAFGLTDANITEPKEDTESYVQVKEPTKINIDTVEVHKCLIND